MLWAQTWNDKSTYKNSKIPTILHLVLKVSIGIVYPIIRFCFTHSLWKMHKKFYHAARIIAAVILLQTLYFKFTAHPESVEIFTTLGMEPEGRILIGIAELIVWLLLLFWRKYIRLGAVGGILLMTGAIFFHFQTLWINQLFWMAVITLICCLYVVKYHIKVEQGITHPQSNHPVHMQ